MTKDAMMLMHKLINTEELKTTEIYELYKQTTNTNLDILQLMSLLDTLDSVIYDFEFLTITGKELNVKRSAVNELIQGMCEEVGKNIEQSLKDQPIILDKYNNCPINSEKVLLSAIPNKNYANFELKKSDFSYLEIGECRKDTKDWYTLYVFELLEK